MQNEIDFISPFKLYNVDFKVTYFQKAESFVVSKVSLFM